MLFPEKVDPRAAHTWLVAAVLAVLLLLPLYTYLAGQSYYLTLVSRMMIYGIAATSLKVLELLFGLREQHARTLVIVTHDPEVAARADRRIALRAGRIEAAAAS